ncbi:recombinase family protein, partial [Lachnospiraceae bacterium ZAX-1]
MNRIDIYMRLSIEDAYGQTESNSITNQRMLIKEFIHNSAEFHGCEIREYYDDGYSGTNFDRLEITRLLAEVKKGNVACIIVKDLSRFSRDYIELGTYLNQIFPFFGIRFIAINDGYDSNGHKGETIGMDTAFQTLLYDLYSKDVSEKVKSAMKSRCGKGEYAFGRVPFGYIRDPAHKNSMIICEKEADLVRHIFCLSAEGLSSVQIAERLYQEQKPTITQIRRPNKAPKDRPVCWAANTVRTILGNRFYLGEWAYGKAACTAVGSSKMASIPEEDWEIIKNHHDPIVSQDLFDSISYKKKHSDTKAKKERHPLTGKLYCGGCGYSMVYKRMVKGKEYRHFECRKHAQLQIPNCCTYFNATVLEELLLSILNKELLKAVELSKGEEDLREV